MRQCAPWFAGVGCLGCSWLVCTNGCLVGRKVALRCCPTESPDVEVAAPGDPDAIPGVLSAPVAADLPSAGKEVCCYGGQALLSESLAVFEAVISLLLLPSSFCSRGDIGRGFPIPVVFRVGREFASSPDGLHSPCACHLSSALQGCVLTLQFIFFCWECRFRNHRFCVTTRIEFCLVILNK